MQTVLIGGPAHLKIQHVPDYESVIKVAESKGSIYAGTWECITHVYARHTYFPGYPFAFVNVFLWNNLQYKPSKLYMEDILGEFWEKL